MNCLVCDRKIPKDRKYCSRQHAADNRESKAYFTDEHYKRLLNGETVLSMSKEINVGSKYMGAELTKYLKAMYLPHIEYGLDERMRKDLRVTMHSKDEMDYGTPKLEYSYIDVSKEDNRPNKQKIIEKYNA